MDLKELEKQMRQQQELLDARSPSEKIRDVLTSPEQKFLENILKELERWRILTDPPKPLHELILSGTVEELSKILKGINFPK